MTQKETSVLIEIQTDLKWMKETFESRLKHLEDNNVWVSRLVIGTIITGMIGAIFLLKK